MVSSSARNASWPRASAVGSVPMCGQDGEGVLQRRGHVRDPLQRGRATSHRGFEPREERGIVGEGVPHVSEAEVDVARLVRPRATRQLGRGLVRGVLLDEAQQIEEGAFAHHGEQERRLREVLQRQ